MLRCGHRFFSELPPIDPDLTGDILAAAFNRALTAPRTGASVE